ncbi:transporter substrate-binding domain-containing protein [Paraglaciecola aquimarina]|uniref:Transporter substrate-binding domain-containing protein n=1 Tax=Paraglaciecola algarum TaxID=3050085 RepID=A0ABS9D5J1_9ALTE|nr:transporter substrate-binding domain-containing protein [Paraglaciecola sp. G1-23]MCF2948196.1 transporter substrate-binding domain-containing protein [Paraglaciecola sp. G1-23]
MKGKLICYLMSGLILIFSCAEAMSASWQITYPRTISDEDKSTEYPLKVLALALEQTGVNYQLTPSEKYYSQGKNLSRLKDNREINVVWSMTDNQREKDLLPIRIPIYKGLIGWRMFLIREDMAERFKYIQNLDHLLKLIPIQGSDWPDTKILQANSFDVVTNINHSALANMLSNAQGDFFPRSILEIWDELASLKTKNKLVIQDSLGLRYPAAMYFFVNNKNRPLAHLINTGLEKAIENGQFDKLFNQTYRSYIEKSKLKKRKFYQLKNSFLPPLTPIDRKELWFNPGGF